MRRTVSVYRISSDLVFRETSIDVLVVNLGNTVDISMSAPDTL